MSRRTEVGNGKGGQRTTDINERGKATAEVAFVGTARERPEGKPPVDMVL